MSYRGSLPPGFSPKWGSEVELHRELDDAAAALQVDLAEVLEGVLGVVEAALGVTDPAREPSRAVWHAVHADIALRLELEVDVVEPEVVGRRRLGEDVGKNPARIWSFFEPPRGKFLKRVMSWEWRPGSSGRRG